MQTKEDVEEDTRAANTWLPGPTEIRQLFPDGLAYGRAAFLAGAAHVRKLQSESEKANAT